MRFGVVVFPGSNCDHDAWYATSRNLGLDAGHEAQYLWHDDTDLKGSDCVILPGGFSYGDYLRCGAIAKFSSHHGRRETLCCGRWDWSSASVTDSRF